MLCRSRALTKQINDLRLARSLLIPEVKEVGKVLDLIRQLCESGVSVILISHRLQDVFTVCDRVMVLRSGERVAERTIADITMDETVKYIVGVEAGNLSAIASGL
jgi:ribose transport system ATP-binding protein